MTRNQKAYQDLKKIGHRFAQHPFNPAADYIREAAGHRSEIESHFIAKEVSKMTDAEIRAELLNMFNID